MQEKVTIQGIMSWLQDQIEKKIPVPPSVYLDAATKITVLGSELDDGLISAEMAYRKLRSSYISNGETAAAAEAIAKSCDEYERYLRLKALREQVDSFVQICKKRTDLQAWDS